MSDDTGNSQALLILEKLEHFKSIINARFDRVEGELRHQSELNRVRQEGIDKALAHIDSVLADHETRIRATTESATHFKFMAGGTGLTSIFAVIRSFFS